MMLITECLGVQVYSVLGAHARWGIGCHSEGSPCWWPLRYRSQCHVKYIRGPSRAPKQPWQAPWQVSAAAEDRPERHACPQHGTAALHRGQSNGDGSSPDLASLRQRVTLQTACWLPMLTVWYSNANSRGRGAPKRRICCKASPRGPMNILSFYHQSSSAAAGPYRGWSYCAAAATLWRMSCTRNMLSRTEQIAYCAQPFTAARPTLGGLLAFGFVRSSPA